MPEYFLPSPRCTAAAQNLGRGCKQGLVLFDTTMYFTTRSIVLVFHFTHHRVDVDVHGLYKIMRRGETEGEEERHAPPRYSYSADEVYREVCNYSYSMLPLTTSLTKIALTKK